ncbi:MAG TPA: DUF2382 domain-containing protein [Longimicrobiaceae bacterium]
MMNDDLDRVVPLDQLDDFKVADGDPDVRGWEVVASDGRKIGEVDQLLVDTAAMKVRYLDVDVDEGLLAGGSDRHVLIPIGYARLDERDDRVIVDNLASADITGLPEYTHGPLTRDYESDLRTRFDTAYTGGAGAMSGTTELGTTGSTNLGGTTRGSTDVNPADAGFYAHDLYDDNRFYGARRGLETEGEARVTRSEEELAVGKRQVEAGEVELRKRVETEHVSQSVPVTHEEVTVERRPITGDALHTGARIEGDEIRVPIMEEEVVVEKRVVPKEELVVRKQQVTETERVEADLRKERVDVDRTGETNLRDGVRDDRL